MQFRFSKEIADIAVIFCAGFITMAESKGKGGNADKGQRPVSLNKANSEAMRESDKINKEEESKFVENENTFPTTLSGFKYEFNDLGQLRHTKTGLPFDFNVKKNDREYNQKHYEALGEIITESVYDLLVTKGNLKKFNIPIDAAPGSPQSFIFMSEDALTNKDKLLIIIHGSGVVRAGQWTRKLIINEDLEHGTQLPYINRAMSEGYGVIVLNTNLNSVVVNNCSHKIKDNSNPEEHGIYVWNNYVSKAKAKHIAVVAHSYGGVVTAVLADSFKEDFERRVFAIAFTDSVHSVAFNGGAIVGNIFYEKAINWVTSDEPIDTPMRSGRKDAERVSAGHDKHEWTSWSSYNSVFNFLQQKYAEIVTPNESDPPPKKTKQDDINAEENDDADSNGSGKPSDKVQKLVVETTEESEGPSEKQDTNEAHGTDQTPDEPMDTSSNTNNVKAKSEL